MGTNPVGPGDLHRHELAAEIDVPAHELGLRLQRHRVDDQPSARTQPGPGGIEDGGIGSAATDEDRVGGRQAFQRGRCGCVDDL